MLGAPMVVSRTRCAVQTGYRVKGEVSRSGPGRGAPSRRDLPNPREGDRFERRRPTLPSENRFRCSRHGSRGVTPSRPGASERSGGFERLFRAAGSRQPFAKARFRFR